MTDPIIPEEEEKETVAVPKKQYDEMVEKLADATQSKVNLVNEIKELREKHQLTAAETEELRKKLEARAEAAPTTELNSDKVAEIATEAIGKILSAKEKDEAKLNKELAMKEFVAKYKEFHPDNDEAGLKLSSLETKFSRFNLSGLKSKEDFMSTLEDARNLVVGNAQVPEESGGDPNPHAPQGGGGGNQPKEANESKLTPKELQLIERLGWDKERYLKQKAKRPDYVATLLEYR